MENCNVNTSGVEAYRQENQEVGEFILNNYYLPAFKAGADNPYGLGVELIISPRCNLGCKYCYVHRYRNQIFNEDVFDEEKTITNLIKFFKWLEKNEYNPDIEIFSGELLAQEIGYKVLETIYNIEKEVPERIRIRNIIIPTNFTFLCSEEATARVEDIRSKLASINIRVGLSASFDGKYMEQNRPYLHDLDIPLNGKGNRDDDYYDRCFQYVKKIDGGFHPMIYSKNIKAWKQNFDWFQEQFKKYDLPWDGIYLLQVRNEEWTQEEIWAFQDFIRYLYAFAWDHCGHDVNYLVDFLLKGQGFNLLGTILSQTGRGLTCGIQGQLIVRLSDLQLYPCHRTGYKDFYFAKMVDDKEKVLKFEITNPELMAATYSIHKESFPYCATCPIKHLCSGTCLGAQYESNKNLLVPIPTVCIVSHALIATSVECLLKYDAYDTLCRLLSPQKVQEFDYVKKEIQNYAKKDC